MKKYALFIVAFISISLLTLPAYCIDTDDWETSLPLAFMIPKPNKDWLFLTASSSIIPSTLAPSQRGYKNLYKYYEKYYDSNLNSLDFRLKKPWHDITNVKIWYWKGNDEKGTYFFGVKYMFKKGSFSLLDVLGRYGHESLEITTNNNLSKEMRYSLVKGSVHRDNPFSRLTLTQKDGQIFMISFHSEDKVFVDYMDIILATKVESD